MSAKSVLFIGGTGVISSASVALATERGWDVSVVNRGRSDARPLPDGVELLQADVRDADAVGRVIGGRSFDVVADFLSFTPEQLHLDRVRGNTGQYVFISSASAVPDPACPTPGDGVDAASESVLGVLAKQDRLRGRPRE